MLINRLMFSALAFGFRSSEARRRCIIHFSWCKSNIPMGLKIRWKK
jgi:hypothetical protein